VKVQRTSHSELALARHRAAGSRRRIPLRYSHFHVAKTVVRQQFSVQQTLCTLYYTCINRVLSAKPLVRAFCLPWPGVRSRFWRIKGEHSPASRDATYTLESVETIDSELRLLVAVRRVCREEGGTLPPTDPLVDALLDERNTVA
jgi:hypothetical protein